MGKSPSSKVNEIVEWPIDAIKPSPENERLYRPVSPDDPEIVKLAESMRLAGQIEPVIITQDAYIISGHRRHCAAKLAKMDSLKVRVAGYRRVDYPDRHLRALREANRQRDKSNAERLREELVDVDIDEAYRALIDERNSKPIDVKTMTLGNVSTRKKISNAKWPMAEAIISLVFDNQKYWPLTDRQIHYMLLNNPPLRHARKRESRYCNDGASYKDLTDMLTRLRVSGQIPMGAIGDETRPVQMWAVYENPREFIGEQLNDFLKRYWRDLMITQPDHIEIVAEKNTVRSLVESVACKYTIPVTTGRGYSSLPPRHAIAERFHASGKDRLVLIVVSDADPEGMDIAASLGRSMRDDFEIEESRVVVIKAAIAPEQAIDLGLPEDATAKLSSSRAQGYIAQYGHHVWELEALDPEKLKSMVQEAIDSVIDTEAFNRELATEKEDARFLEGVRRAAKESLGDLAELADDEEDGHGLW